MDNQQPLVSIVTPVYNGEQFLHQCIQSVISQAYDNWEYIILDNCSTDHTPQIIQEYGNAEPRIKIFTNDELLPIMDNWNLALGHISANSNYCKVIHADDFLLPECLAEMVKIGEKHPSAGIISAYAIWGGEIACDGIPYEDSLVPGKTICRQTLKREIYPFLSPSTLMLRSNLIQQRPNFYSEESLEADVDILYELLKQVDFGFCHKVLTFVRKHENSATSTLAQPLNTLLPQKLKLLKKYGPNYLSKKELKNELQLQLFKYYLFLAKSILKGKGNKFWSYHISALQELELPLSRLRLTIFWLTHRLKKLMKRLNKFLIYSRIKN